jgi:hypothetical protein
MLSQSMWGIEFMFASRRIPRSLITIFPFVRMNEVGNRVTGRTVERVTPNRELTHLSPLSKKKKSKRENNK